MQIYKTSFLAVFALTVLLVLSSSSGLAKDRVQAKIAFKTDLSQAKTQDTFSAYDKIYALVTLSNLQPGPNNAVINWIDPTGAINQYKKNHFTVTEQNGYTFYSWIRLLKNGPLKSTLSGRRFDDEYIGRWELHLFINGALLKKTAFEIHP